MPAAKMWLKLESSALARSWMEISEETEDTKLKGTGQDSDRFWDKVVAKFETLAPTEPKALAGRYHTRGRTAIKNQWKDKIARDVRKFNKSYLLVLQSNPTGCTEQNIIHLHGPDTDLAAALDSSSIESACNPNFPANQETLSLSLLWRCFFAHQL